MGKPKITIDDIYGAQRSMARKKAEEAFNIKYHDNYKDKYYNLRVQLNKFNLEEIINIIGFEKVENFIRKKKLEKLIKK